MNEVVNFEQSNNVPAMAGNQMPMAVGETLASTLAAQSEAAVKARYAMAVARPRNFDQMRVNLLKDCQRPSFANVAIYHKPVGKGIEGASIRFVESALRHMGNTYIETLTTYDDSEKRIIRVSVTDLETNTYYNQDVTVTKTVERSKCPQGEIPIRVRKNSLGKNVFILPATDDDILNKVNALISKAVRTLGLRLIPGDIVDEALGQVRETMNNRDAKDPDAAKRRIVDAFNSIGISPEELTDYLGHSLDAMQPAELQKMRGIFAAIRDGETTWKSVVNAEKPKEEVSAEQPKKSASKQQPKHESKVESNDDEAEDLFG